MGKMKTTQKLVQVGRVAYVAYGPDKGKLITIVDLIDTNRALVDGPTTGVRRQSMNIKSLYLTKFRVRIPHSARERTFNKAIKEKMTDFDRFKLMRAKQARNNMIKLEIGKLRIKLSKKGKKTATKKPAAKTAKK